MTRIEEYIKAERRFVPNTQNEYEQAMVTFANNIIEILNEAIAEVTAEEAVGHDLGRFDDSDIWKAGWAAARAHVAVTLNEHLVAEP